MQSIDVDEVANDLARASQPLLTLLNQVALGLRELSAAFSPAFHAASAAMECFGEAYYKKVEHEYLRHHRCLPGSLSTRRLRKKRRTKVLAWWEKRVKDELGSR